MIAFATSLIVPLSAATPAKSLAGMIVASSTTTNHTVDLGNALSSTPPGTKSLIVLGIHAADFNMVEYCQRVRFFLPQLQCKGVNRFILVVNGKISACKKLTELLDLPESMELYADPTGEAGRRFGVSRGFRPDDARFSPALRLFCQGVGIGPPWATLGAVVAGYVGNPDGRRDFIEDGLLQGQLAGRWPAVLKLGPNNSILRNNFDEFPLLGSWGLRPFELATLRLQNLIGIQIKNWDALKPEEPQCLTQMGGCAVVGGGGEPLYSWVDRGLCDMPNFQVLIDSL
jgi:hypothetical protein